MRHIAHSPNFILILAAVLCLLLTVAACAMSAANAPELTEAPTLAVDTAFRHHISGVTVPADYRDTFTRYATVERVDGTIRDIYINPEALPHLDISGALPNYTTIVIEAYNAVRDSDGNLMKDDQGHFIQGAQLAMIHVIQKRSDWSPEDFPGSDRSGTWNFGSFTADASSRYDESLSTCFQCHNVTGGTDFLYSRTLLAYYIMTGQPQYFYCDLTGRAACSIR